MTFRGLAVWLIAVTCAHAQLSAIVDVTVIDPGTDSRRAGMTVVVDGRQIRSVQAGSAAIPRGARRIDGTGKFLIPGLQDSHVHLTKAGEGSLALFVANGVTSVRDVGSDLAEVSAWRKRIESGRLVGPRITTSGQILESRANVERMKREGGVEPVDRIRMPVANADEARQAVRRLKAGGADHVKMRTTPDDATFLAAAEEANRVGLPFSMHAVAPLDAMIRARVRSVEHFPAFSPLGLDADARLALFRKAAAAGMMLSTTLINVDGSILVDYETAKRRLATDPLRKYVCGYLVKDWVEQVEERKGGAYDDFIKMLPGLYRDVREMNAAGVKTIAGTDVGVVFMYPGFGLHDELGKLVQHAGFSPMEALRSATVKAAAFHKKDNRYGSIVPGGAADLVLLDADPLVDIRNTARIQGVMLQGRWFDRLGLDGLLKGVEDSCSRQ